MSMKRSAAEIESRLHAMGRRSEKTGPSDAPASVKGRMPRVTEVMALAIHFQDMIQRSEAHDYADLARLGSLTRERMSQIMELVWLAPDIQQEILEFRPTGRTQFPISEVAVRRVAENLCWLAQREVWRKLKHDSHLD